MINSEFKQQLLRDLETNGFSCSKARVNPYGEGIECKMQEGFVNDIVRIMHYPRDDGYQVKIDLPNDKSVSFECSRLEGKDIPQCQIGYDKPNTIFPSVNEEYSRREATNLWYNLINEIDQVVISLSNMGRRETVNVRVDDYSNPYWWCNEKNKPSLKGMCDDRDIDANQRENKRTLIAKCCLKNPNGFFGDIYR